jgi:hypothetical protein
MGQNKGHDPAGRTSGKQLCRITDFGSAGGTGLRVRAPLPPFIQVSKQERFPAKRLHGLSTGLYDPASKIDSPADFEFNRHPWGNPSIAPASLQK